jgi:hypothetical protein
MPVKPDFPASITYNGKENHENAKRYDLRCIAGTDNDGMYHRTEFKRRSESGLRIENLKQNHMEITKKEVENLIANCGSNISAAPCVQTPEEMVSDGQKFRNINSLKIKFLNL